jgi:hypothetical protein
LSIQQNCIEGLVDAGFIVVDVRRGIPEEVREVSRQAVEATGLIGFLDHFFILLRDRQLKALKEDRLAREMSSSGIDLSSQDWNLSP